MSIQKDIAKTSSTSELSSAYRAESSSDIGRETTELECQRQDSLPELPLLLRKTRSTPITNSSGNTSGVARGRRKVPFKIDLPPRFPDEFVKNYEQADFLRVTGTKIIEQPFTIVQKPSVSTSISPFHLSHPEELQVLPPEILPSETPPSFLVPQLDAASMASNDSEIGVSEDEQEKSSEASVKLDLDGVATTVADYLAQGQLTVPTLDVVHQPLPFPLPSRFSGINSPTASLFSRLVNTLRHDNRLSASHVRIQHVLSDTMLPENYPISPLVTPSSLARNSDQHGYFAVKTLFSSITTSTGVALPPGQAHICITERTIPPAGEVEILSFLSDATDSGFMIRLNELAPGGIFVLALPTSHGARTFHNKCLSKILDPILRSIVFRLGLQSELAKDISNAIVLKQFLPYDQMQTKIQTILSTANTTAFFPSARPSFKLIHATKGTLPLPFENWYAWWLGQERSRIMALLNYHLNVRGQGLIASSVAPLSGNSPNATRSSVMLELDKEMRKTGEDQLFVSEVEIAVFMVQRVE